MRKVWIEVALNGAWSRALQPGIPDTVDAIVREGVACAKAGAAIVHMHAYDGGGPQTFDWQVYARIIEGIRNQVDVVVYPSYPARSYALLAYVSLLQEVGAQPLWMIAGFSADGRPLIGETVARGGHVRVGLEDAPLGSKQTNLAWVEDAVRLVRQHGGGIASSADVRQDLQATA